MKKWNAYARAGVDVDIEAEASRIGLMVFCDAVCAVSSRNSKLMSSHKGMDTKKVREVRLSKNEKEWIV